MNVYLYLAAIQHLEDQRGERETDEWDNQRNDDVVDAEDARASDELVLRCAVYKTVPDSGQRQQTAQQNSQTDETMDSSTVSAMWRVDGRQQQMILAQLLIKFHRELDAEPRQLSIVYNSVLEVQLQLH